MKKIIFVVMIFSVFICSCQNKYKKSTAITTDFSCDYIMSCVDTMYTGKITSGNGGFFAAEIDSPSTVSGLSFCWEEDKLDIKFCNIKCDLKKEQLPLGNSFLVIRRILLGANNNPINYVSNEYVINGNDTCGKFKLTFRPDGFPKILDVPAIGLNVKFENIKYSF